MVVDIIIPYLIDIKVFQAGWQLRQAAQVIVTQIEHFQIIEPPEDALRQAAQVIVPQTETFQIIEPPEDALRQAAQVIVTD